MNAKFIVAATVLGLAAISAGCSTSADLKKDNAVVKTESNYRIVAGQKFIKEDGKWVKYEDASAAAKARAQTEHAWDKTKEVTNDAWDKTKEKGRDVKDAVTK